MDRLDGKFKISCKCLVDLLVVDKLNGFAFTVLLNRWPFFCWATFSSRNVDTNSNFISFWLFCSSFSPTKSCMQTPFSSPECLKLHLIRHFCFLQPHQLHYICRAYVILAIEKQVSRLITVNYAFIECICIPLGTGSGMATPVSSLCCWKTEGWCCLFLLFLPSLLFKALLALKSHPWVRSAGDTDDTLKEYKQGGPQGWERREGRVLLVKGLMLMMWLMDC